MIIAHLLLHPQDGRLRAALYAQQAVAEEFFREDGVAVASLRVPKSDLLRILSAQKIQIEDLVWAE
jgi:GTP-binding protein HflX